MDILEIIRADHDAILAQLERLEGSVADDDRASEAMIRAVHVTVAIKLHAKVEEKVLYEAIKTGSLELREHALEGRFEHEAIELLLDRLLVQRPGPQLRAVVHVVSGLFEHHAKLVEEAELFPCLREALTEAERAQLGRDMFIEKRRMLPQIERQVGPAARGSHDVRPGLHIHGLRRF